MEAKREDAKCVGSQVPIAKVTLSAANLEKIKGVLAFGMEFTTAEKAAVPAEALEKLKALGIDPAKCGFLPLGQLEVKVEPCQCLLCRKLARFQRFAAQARWN